MKEKKNKWVILIIVLIVLFVIGYFLAGIISLFTGKLPNNGNVALIPVEGVITASGSSSILGEQGASSTDIVDLINKANDNPDIKAILLEINSPGGSGVASEEIANALKHVNKTKVSYIREVGASGAYWIATATDRIFASKMSITGSIGVLASYIEYAGLMKKYNITYRKLTGGEYKDIGSPYRELTPTETGIIQEQLDLMHDLFITEVAKNRKLPKSFIEQYAKGDPIIGMKAQEAGLIDEIGGKEEAIKYIEKKIGATAEVSEYRTQRTLLDLLSNLMQQNSYSIGLGIGQGMLKEDRQAVWT